MFGYWPWVGLISIIVLFAAVIVIKWGDKVCQARLTVVDHSLAQQYPPPPQGGDFELMEDGNGTMMDYQLQEGGSLGGSVMEDYSPHGRDSRLTFFTRILYSVLFFIKRTFV